MYAAHFGFRDQPFSITPDPTYLYMSPHHQEALAHLLYGTGELGGFVQLTGEVGTGKTTLVRTLAEQHIEQLDVALCLNPRLTVVEFMAALCDELKIHYPPQVTTLKPLVDALNQHLLTTHAEGRRTVLIIDEAQNLSPEVLEQVRLLTNLETHRHKLLRIILVGQPELQQLLSRRDMRQLAQRITARYHLLPLSADQTRAYVQHRLRIAGAREGVFTAAALRSVHRITRGIPRLINVICDRALLASYVQGLDQVNATVLRRAAREALHGSHRSANHKLTAGATIAAALLLAIALGWFALNTRRVEPQPPPPTASQTSEAEHSVQSSPIVAMVEALADPSPETIATLPPPATTISTVAPPLAPRLRQGQNLATPPVIANAKRPALTICSTILALPPKPWVSY